MKAVVHMLEHGIQDRLEPYPWETATCIGEWHYKRGDNYKTAEEVVRLLVDVVSKNGVLVVNVPLRGDGSIDNVELKFIARDMAPWIAVNGEAIYGTRPWLIFGKVRCRSRRANSTTRRRRDSLLPTSVSPPRASRSMRLPWRGPANGRSSLPGEGFAAGDRATCRRSACSATMPLWVSRGTSEALKIRLPEQKPCEYAFAFKITGLKTNAAGLAALGGGARDARPKAAGTLMASRGMDLP